MNSRIRKKRGIQKSAVKSDANRYTSSNTVCYNAKVIATSKILTEMGIEDDLSNKVVKVLQDYKDGFKQVQWTPVDIVNTDRTWDIPSEYLVTEDEASE
jgi:hypothetical protein